jgi:pyruvate kinase
MERRTKIIATIGPASQDEQTIKALIQAGMDVARLNFSHGSYAEHAARIECIRRISTQLSKPVTILQDLQGPKIRTGEIKNGSVQLIPEQSLTLTTYPIIGDEKQISVDYPGLPGSVNPGSRILLDDGNLELVVTGIEKERVETLVSLGGVLKSHKGVNLPGVLLEISGFTEKDKRDLAFGLEQGVDAIAMSFVRSVKDVEIVRDAIASLAPDKTWMPVISKLERPEALQNLDEIVHASDGVMVARGDLGVEMSPETVPIAQKEIIEKANCHARVVITATQMLDSMIHNPRPTRAEASDVANAIFDGSDAVMLSGETAAGQYPVQSVSMMNSIICQAEAHLSQWGHWKGTCAPESNQDDAFFMTLAARELAHDRNVAAIGIFTKSGRTALLMSKTRPGVPILAFTPEVETYHRMGMYWGVQPHLVTQADTIEDMLKVVEAAMVTSSSVEAGQQVVVICGFPVKEIRPTNLALLYTVGKTL